MRQVSSGFVEASLSPIGNANAYIDINGTIIDASKLTEITINENIGSSGSFTIGTFNTVEATMTVLNSALPSTVAGMPIKIYFGYLVGNAYEYVPMGTFYAQPRDISRKNLFTTINAHDKSWRMTDAYQTSLNWSSTHTAREVLNEVATQAEITFGTFGGLNPSNVTVYEAPGGSLRDVIAQMALLTGTNAKINRSGSIDFIRAYPFTPVEEYGPYNYTSSGFTITSQASVNYGKVTVNYKYEVSGEEQTQTFNYTAGTGSNAIVIDTKNVRTQTQTNTLGQMIIGNGFSYFGYNAVLPGQPQIDLGDTISIEGIFGETNNLLVLQATHTFNGAMESTFSAVANDTDPEMNGGNISGSITEQVSSINDAAQYAKGRADYAATKADEAAASAQRAENSASAAATSASNAESFAQASAQSAQASANSASASAQSASNSEASAQASAQSAHNAEVSAGEAEDQAELATKYANSALGQLGVVEDVMGVLNWATEHCTFTQTTDTEIRDSKVYFTYDSERGDYVPVVDPQESALSTYYELTTVDEAMETYIMSHLAVTSRGLWVLPSGMGNNTTPETGETQKDSDARQGANYKVLLSNDGFYVYDENGVDVTTVGENITFNSTRPQYIGNEHAYVAYSPNNGGTLTIGGATINLSGQTLTEALADLESNANQTNEAFNGFKDKYEGYIAIDTETPSITLGKSDASSKVEITDSAVNIYSDNKKSAYVDGQTFNAYEGKFETVMMQTMNGVGKLRWVARSNGHLSLKVVN